LQLQNSKQQNIFLRNTKFFLVSIFKVMLKKQTKKFDVFSFFSAMSSIMSDSVIVAWKHVSILSKICEKNVKIFGAKINFWPLHEKKTLEKRKPSSSHSCRFHLFLISPYCLLVFYFFFLLFLVYVRGYLI
jgi:hypothetical protein